MAHLASDITYPARYLCMKIGTDGTSRSQNTDIVNKFETHPACRQDYVMADEKIRNTPVIHRCCLSDTDIRHGDCCDTECGSKITYKAYTPGQKNRLNINDSDSQIDCSYDCKAKCFKASHGTRVSEYKSKCVLPQVCHVHYQTNYTQN